MTTGWYVFQVTFEDRSVDLIKTKQIFIGDKLLDEIKEKFKDAGIKSVMFLGMLEE